MNLRKKRLFFGISGKVAFRSIWLRHDLENFKKAPQGKKKRKKKP